MGLTLFVVIGTLVSIRFSSDRQDIPSTKEDLQNLILGLADEPMTDPNGLFSITPPSGWRIHSGQHATPYNIVFKSLNGPNLSILTTRPTTFENMKALRDELIRRGQNMGVYVPEEIAFLGPRKVIKRIATLHTEKVMTLDFIEDNATHHLQFSAPLTLFDQYLPLIQDILETYTSLPAPPAT